MPPLRPSRSVRSMPLAARLSARLLTIAQRYKEKFSAAKAQSEQEAEGLRAQLREQELTAKMNLSEAGRRGRA